MDSNNSSIVGSTFIEDELSDFNAKFSKECICLRRDMNKYTCCTFGFPNAGDSEFTEFSMIFDDTSGSSSSPRREAMIFFKL